MIVRHLYILIVLLITVGLCSCSKDFLEKTNPQTVPVNSAITDLPTLINAENGAYAFFQNVNYYNRSFTLIPELLGDNVFISSNNVGFYLNFDNFTPNADDGYLLGAWANMYGAIGNANLVIAASESITFNPTVQGTVNQIAGEMYAVRALAHFDLVRLFAQPYNFSAGGSHPGVPVVTAPQSQIISPARNSVAEVYTQIISDLSKAISLMNAQQKNGYFTPAAAKALLAKVYLYKEDWENAERYTTEIIQNEPYRLLTTAEYVPSWQTDFSAESLFEIENTPTNRPGVNGIGAFYEQGQYGNALATADLYNQYSLTDVRRQLIELGVRQGGENPAYIVHKYPKGRTSQDDNIKVLRLSEVYLIRAEARAHQQAKQALAQADLNVIVKRADPLAVDISLTETALINRIILERRKELAFEGNRFFDLTRNKMNVTHIETERTRVINYPNDDFAMPIPQTELNANPNIVPNP